MDNSDKHGWAEIEELRRRLDEIDNRLVELLNERVRRVMEIGRIKHAAGLPLYQPERERKILETIEATNPGPLSGLALRRLFERILDESRSVERHAMEPGSPGGRESSHPEGENER